MEVYLICLATALIGGLLLSRLTKLIHLPAVTAYLVAGLLLGPFVWSVLHRCIEAARVGLQHFGAGGDIKHRHPNGLGLYCVYHRQ